MKGLINLGNTCYFNAGLQLLMQNKDLCNLILHNGNKSIILNTISQFIIQYNTNDNNVINPIEIKKLIDIKQPNLQGFEQQDSTEFIIFFLDLINDEINKINNNSNIINKLFGIDFNVRIKCKLTSCLTIYNIKQNNNFLLLDIYDNIDNLEEMINMIKKHDKLENDNKYYCEKCKDYRIASKRLQITNFSNHLFIWIKRFNNLLQKNNKLINIPFQWNNMELIGAIIHFGNINGGHYIYINKLNNEHWVLFNDNTLNAININQTQQLLQQSYFIYYKKIN
jgi:ubiquitin carboxyl-terminal hydrolase 36/42